MLSWALAIAFASAGAGFQAGPEARVSVEAPRLRLEAFGAYQHKWGAVGGYRWGARALVTTPDAWYVGAGAEARGYLTTWPNERYWQKVGVSPTAEAGWRDPRGRVSVRVAGPSSSPNHTWVLTGYLEARLGGGLSGWAELSGMRYLQGGQWEHDTYSSLGLAWRW